MNIKNIKESSGKNLFLPLYLFSVLLMVSACSAIDCPMESRVYANYYFMKMDGTTDTVADTLTATLRLPMKDSIVFNKGVSTTKISIPMSYSGQEDMLFLTIADTSHVKTTDTIWIQKENHPHFESVDCAPKYFHTLTGVRFTRNRIENIVINNKEVTYGTQTENIYVYLSPDF